MEAESVLTAGIVYVNDIPKVPEDLLESIDVIINKVSMSPKNYVHNKRITKKLHQWLCKSFGMNLIAYYQVISDNIGPHVDRNRTRAHNYILQTGGTNVRTLICNEKSPPGRYLGPITVKEQLAIEPFRWHYIDVTQVHTVVGIEPGCHRISLSVTCVENFDVDANKDYTDNRYVESDSIFKSFSVLKRRRGIKAEEGRSCAVM